MSSEGTMARIHQRRGVAGRNVRSSPSEEDPKQRGLDHGVGGTVGEGHQSAAALLGLGEPRRQLDTPLLNLGLIS